MAVAVGTGIHWHDISSLSIICLLLKMNFHLKCHPFVGMRVRAKCSTYQRTQYSTLTAVADDDDEEHRS